jgi:two-component system phosphate regulon sensor histidine kinase PhoR
VRFFRRLDSSRSRLFAGYILIAALFAAGWLWWLYGPFTQSVITQRQSGLVGVARSAALAVTSSPIALQRACEMIVRGTDFRLTVVAANGKVLADTAADPKTLDNHANRPEVKTALTGAVGQSHRRSQTLHEDMVYAAVPAYYRGNRVAVRVGEPLQSVLDIAAESQRFGLLLLAVTLGVSSAVAAWAAKAISDPVRRLTRAAQSMAAGDLSTALPEVPSDVAPLAHALDDLRNQIHARIDDLVSEQRTLRTGLDGIPDAVFLLENGSIRFTNSAASRIFTPPTGGWKKRSIDEVGLPASLVGVIESGIAEGTSQSAEIGPDPTGRYLRVITTALRPTERGPRYLIVVADMTDRMRIDRIRRDFVANASHELKTPVAGIQLLAESAETAAEDGDVNQAVAFARQISAESTRLKRLVTDLLDLSRLETAPSPSSIVDVRKAALNAVVGHRAAAQRKGLALRVDDSMVRGQDVFAFCDSTDLAVALDNLVDNAIAYTEDGSVIVHLATGDGRVLASVTDTGIGIPNQDLSRVFERFYRVDRGRSRDSGGTGLGLSLVKHVVERSGGTISVTSEPGRGSTFTIELRRAS